MTADPEYALVRSARTGNPRAFEELVRRTSRLVYVKIWMQTGDAHRAEDLLQETLLTAFRSLGQLRDPNGFRPWLMKIAQNTCIDAARKDHRQKRSGPEVQGGAALRLVPTDDQLPEAEAEQREQQQHVLAVLNAMPEEYRQPLTLRYIGGADYETICQQLKITNGALRGLLHRGLALLREEFAKRDQPLAALRSEFTG